MSEREAGDEVRGLCRRRPSRSLELDPKSSGASLKNFKQEGSTISSGFQVHPGSHIMNGFAEWPVLSLLREQWRRGGGDVEGFEIHFRGGINNPK